ncbi:MAG TPA: hypothetical protein VFC86_05500 [Planctomycetota bacterium]|nr:hypothetical protein [Planctomycetota bacterium]
MKIGWLGATLLVAAVLLVGPSLAFADDAAKAVDKESTGIFTSILRILIRWIFPLGAAYCFLYGIVGKGVKRGEWDMAAICAVAAIALALFPKLLGSVFDVDMGPILK